MVHSTLKYTPPRRSCQRKKPSQAEGFIRKTQIIQTIWIFYFNILANFQ